MLDQNTDRMWYVIGAVLVGTAIILIANGTFPQMFASVADSFDDVISNVQYDFDGNTEDLINKGYIPIATAEELNSIRSNTKRTYGKGTEWEDEYIGGIDKKYIQVDNIDLSEHGVWTPIGSSPISASFSGIYDGGNYVITGLKVEGKDYQGLFGRTESATIRNVGLIDNKVTGSGHDVGGLVGFAGTSIEIINSYTTGSVIGTGGVHVGGLVGGAHDITIENSYTTGSVIGGNYVGGLLGWTGDSWAGDNINISNSYATGLVKGTNEVGGLVGYAGSGTVTSSYWDKDITGQLSSSRGGTGKTTEEMKKKETYTDWDFDTIWEIDEGNDYPILR